MTDDMQDTINQTKRELYVLRQRYAYSLCIPQDVQQRITTLERRLARLIAVYGDRNDYLW